MPYTSCPYCNKYSYSAADLKVWTCPYCGKKVTENERDVKDSVKEQEH